MQNPPPSQADAANIVALHTGGSVRTVRRFTTGSQHFVFDVETDRHGLFVVRMARPENRAYLRGAVYWSNRLRPMGIRLPRLLHDGSGTETPFPFIILERLPGTDLAHVYGSLTSPQKKLLASEVAQIQKNVGSLPEGNSYGFLHSYEESSPHCTWSDVVRSQLARSRSRIRDAGMLDPAYVDRVERHAGLFESYFTGVRPVAFLDDTTTKNVIVHDGRLSGIVDVDMVCFGDPLFTVALTRMALLNDGQELDYIDYWCEHLNLTAERERVLTFYTALFCVDFMGEIGQIFNREQAEPVEETHVIRLTRILDTVLAGL